MDRIAMIHYNKAVRDLIPEIIKAQGKSCTTKTLPNQEYLPYLEAKLQEELDEFTGSRDLMELADLVELIHRIIEIRGSSIEEMENLRESKKKERGGFQKNVVLLTVQN